MACSATILLSTTLCPVCHTRQVDIPTLALVARDDPLCPPEVWKKAVESASKSPGIMVAITEYGGHCGFFEGICGSSWLDRVGSLEHFVGTCRTFPTPRTCRCV